MADQKFILPDTETVSMSGRAADLLIGCGCPEAALVYIYMLKTGGAVEQDTAAVLKISKERFNIAVSVLNRLGLVKCENTVGDKYPVPAEKKPLRPERADELPDYSIADIKREIENGAQFSMLVGEVQRALGRILSSDDLIKLFGIYDCLRLPPEVILQLVMYCIEENQRKYGGLKKPTMRYIEKVAYTWEREGIFSLEHAEAYIKNLAKQREMLTQFAQALQIRGRELTVTERRYITEWINMGFSPESAAVAYDRTVMQTGRLVWKYMDSILRNWHSRNIHTAADIEKNDPRTGQSAPLKKLKQEAEAPTAADIERMRKTLEKIKEG